MEIELRKAVTGDEGWLFELHEAAHGELVEAAFGPWIIEQQEEFFRPLFEDHEVFVVVVEGRAMSGLSI